MTIRGRSSLCYKSLSTNRKSLLAVTLSKIRIMRMFVGRGAIEIDGRVIMLLHYEIWSATGIALFILEMEKSEGLWNLWK